METKPNFGSMLMLLVCIVIPLLVADGLVGTLFCLISVGLLFGVTGCCNVTFYRHYHFFLSSE